MAAGSTGVRLLSAVLRLGHQRLVVVAETVESKQRRRVVVTWEERESTDVVPRDWLGMVLGELSFQDSARENALPTLRGRRQRR